MSRATRRHLHPRGSAAPPGYPPEYERLATLTDGRVVHLRPVVPADAADLRRAAETADPETLHTRFLGGRPPKTDAEFERLVRLDYDRRFAVAAFSDDGTGVGIARYEAEPGSDRAEVAIVVDPGWRRVRLATALVRLLAEAAIGNGIRVMTLEFLVDNVDVASLVADTGLPVAAQHSNDVVEVTIDVSGAMDVLT